MRKRNKFSLSFYKLFTCKMGYLLPMGLIEVLPGDTIRHATGLFMRLAPMLAPVMHPCRVTIHTWFVPHRLVWDDFEKFITGGEDGLDTSVLPTITAPTGGFPVGSLADYLGVTPGVEGLEVSALPFRAYNLIYNEWYRDQDLEESVPFSTDSGPDTTTSTALLRGDWERDYFNTARPWPQKGLAVSVPVQGSTDNRIVSDGTTTTFSFPGSTSATGTYPLKQFTDFGLFAQGTPAGAMADSPEARFANSGLRVEGSSGVVDINQLREAFALQRFEEHRAMYGSRYVEYLRYLGIKASDARLQRPEYLGGGRQTIQFSEVLQTAEGTDPVGTLRGHGIASMRSNRYRRFIEEHGYILSFLLVRPKSIYMQGLDRTWLRRVKEDFWQKELEHIGQQEVYTQELYAAADPGTVFGYQNRYDDYRQHWSSVSGEFRDILDYWHMARSFSNEPVLNADFISSVPTERIFAAQQNDQLYCFAQHSVQARRLMAKFGNPI